jgi:hexosaminidase
MIWQYTTDIRNLPKTLWHKYGRVFGNVWIASSFKGATGSSQFRTNIAHHLQNHLSWLDLMKTYGTGRNPVVNIRGITLTGWQRYDHFAALCELLPVALPSLAICLQTLANGGFTTEVHASALTILGCESIIPLYLEEQASESVQCSFPGYDIYHLTNQVAWFQGGDNIYLLGGWLNEHHMKYNVSNPWHVQDLMTSLSTAFEAAESLERRIQKTLTNYFDHYTAEEWLDINFRHVTNKYRRHMAAARAILSRSNFPRKPLLSA